MKVVFFLIALFFFSLFIGTMFERDKLQAKVKEMEKQSAFKDSTVQQLEDELAKANHYLHDYDSMTPIVAMPPRVVVVDTVNGPLYEHRSK